MPPAPTPPRLLPRLLLVVLASSIAAGAAIAWKRHAREAHWAALRPSLPPASGDTAPGLDARLAALAARFHDTPPDSAALAEFTQVAHANGHLETAAAGYRALISLQPAEPRWAHLLALILAGFGRLDEAVPLHRRAAQLAPDTLVAWLKLGDALLKSNSLADAETAYREVLHRDPENRFALLGLARCDLQSDRLTSARANLQRAVVQHPDFASGQSLLGTVFERLGNPDAAALARTRVQQGGHYSEPADPWFDDLVFESHDPYTLLIAASAAIADNHAARAHRLLDRGLSLAPYDARLRRQFGKLLATEGDFTAARRELERAVQLDPANDALRFDLLALLRRIGDEDAFARSVADGVLAAPGSIGLRFEAGRLAAQAGDLDAAIAHLEFSWRHGPDQPSVGLELADALARHGRTSDAITVLEDVHARFPHDHSALLRLIRHGIETDDARTADWLEHARTAEIPAPVLAELRDSYRRRVGFAR